MSPFAPTIRVVVVDVHTELKVCMKGPMMSEQNRGSGGLLVVVVPFDVVCRTCLPDLVRV